MFKSMRNETTPLAENRGDLQQPPHQLRRGPPSRDLANKTGWRPNTWVHEQTFDPGRKCKETDCFRSRHSVETFELPQILIDHHHYQDRQTLLFFSRRFAEADETWLLYEFEMLVSKALLDPAIRVVNLPAWRYLTRKTPPSHRIRLDLFLPSPFHRHLFPTWKCLSHTRLVKG